jgi:hypothetical protein
MMKNVFVDTGECNVVVLVINLLFKASKVATLDEVKLWTHLFPQEWHPKNLL